MDGFSARSAINIVILTPGFPADEQDTSSMPALQQLVRTLPGQYPDIRLQIVAIQFPYCRDSFTWNGIPVHPADGRSGTWNRLSTWVRVLRILKRLRREGKADLVHAFWLTEAALLGALFRLLSGVPLLVTAMGQDVKGSNRYLALLRPFHLKTVLISEYQKHVLGSRKNLEMAGIIPFGTDSAHECTGPEPRTIDILGAGSLNRIKNYPEFLEVVASVARQIPGLRVVIAGEGTEYPALLSQVRTLGLEDMVTLAGRLEYGDLQKLMRTAKVLLHTSVFEGQGMVITEALAAGMYVVCHPVGTAWSFRSPNLLTGSTSEDLAELVYATLTLAAPDHSPKIWYKLADTCREYQLLYRSLLNR